MTLDDVLHILTLLGANVDQAIAEINAPKQASPVDQAKIDQIHAQLAALNVKLTGI